MTLSQKEPASGRPGIALAPTAWNPVGRWIDGYAGESSTRRGGP